MIVRWTASITGYGAGPKPAVFMYVRRCVTGNCERTTSQGSLSLFDFLEKAVLIAAATGGIPWRKARRVLLMSYLHLLFESECMSWPQRSKAR